MLCCDATGSFLSGVEDATGDLSKQLYAGDECMWELLNENKLRCAANGAIVQILSIRLCSDPHMLDGESICIQRCHGEMVDGTHEQDDALTNTKYTVRAGPTRRPSEHLMELRAQGYTVLDGVLSREAVSELKADVARVRMDRFASERTHDGHFWMMDMLKESSHLCRAVAHPVSLWIFLEHMGCNIHYCHQPIVNTLRPAARLKGTPADAGQNLWHTDYPYHQERIAGGKWPEGVNMGVQYNICVDEFRKDNGATQFILGSHLKSGPPPADVRASQLPEAVQIEAPAGSAILYDARTWHRQCPELNVSGRDRIAVLNAVAPSWVVPMLDKGVEAERYQRSKVPCALSQRERTVVDLMCCRPTASSQYRLVKGRPGSPTRHFGQPRTQ